MNLSDFWSWHVSLLLTPTARKYIPATTSLVGTQEPLRTTLNTPHNTIADEICTHLTVSASTNSTKARTFRKRWLLLLRSPPPCTCGSVCATPASSTSDSGPVQLPVVNRTGPQDRDPGVTMTAGWQVPLRPLGGSSGWDYLTGRDWTSSALVLDDHWHLAWEATVQGRGLSSGPRYRATF